MVNRWRAGRRRGSTSIMRPGPLGNPFVIGPDGTREEVLRKYRAYLPEQLRRDPELRRLVEALGRSSLVLLCACAPKACHGDILSEYLAKGRL